MNRKNKTIPNVPKEDRISFEYGYHNLSNCEVVAVIVVVFVMVLLYFVVD